MKRAGPHSTLSPSQKTDAPANAEGVRFPMCRPDSKEIGKYCEQGFDKVKNLWEGWGGLEGAGRTFSRKSSPPPQVSLLFIR